MTDAKRREILNSNKAMADRALRVLAVAKRDWAEEPENNAPEYLEKDLVFLGLTGMIDPIRPEVKAAIAECRGAGIRAVMITGDHRDTAVAIAKELGIITDESPGCYRRRAGQAFAMSSSAGRSRNTACTPAFSRSTKRVSSRRGRLAEPLPR